MAPPPFFPLDINPLVKQIVAPLGRALGRALGQVFRAASVTRPALVGTLSLRVPIVPIAAFAIAVSSVGAPATSYAQAPPSPAEVRALMRDTANIARVRQELERSGMTQAQIRARLRAMGYAESTLDAILAARDTSAVLTEDVFAAVRALGVMDSLALDSLRSPRFREQRLASQEEAALLDSVRRVIQNDTGRAAIRLALQNPRARSALADSGFAIFGQDVFERSSTQFDANIGGPVDDSYRIGPRDQLVITLTGDVERSHSVTVVPEGFIVFENLGPPLYVANLTKREVEAQLYSRLSRSYSGLRPGNTGSTQMLLSIARQGSRMVRVTGDVTTPGQYPVPSSSTIISALYHAGGPTQRGTMRNVHLVRGSQVVGVFDVYDYLTRGSSADDFRVESNDVIFVPPRGPRVRIAGEVIRPATYEIKPGETLQDLVRLAGGFTASADHRRLQIERILPPAQRVASGRDRWIFDITDPALASANGPPVPLEADDIVRVLPIANAVGGRIVVLGNVWSGGTIAFTPGMRLSDALQRAGGIKSDTYLGQVNILRLRADSTRTLLRSGLRDATGTPASDIELADGDEIEVFSLTTFRPERWVQIEGAVNRPGKYPYREGMTARDLALMADGLHEGALLTEAELSRLPTDRDGGVLATTTKVSLDSLYLFERGASGRYLGPPGLPGAARSQEVVLEAYDHLLIHWQPDFAYPRTVYIWGEVRLPGTYTLKSKHERLSDIIERAGGLTGDAYPNGVSLIRNKGSLGRIGVDLPAVLRDPAHIDNLLMVDGDDVHIPPFSGIVTVRGEVNSPVAVAYVRGANLDYYVRAAGGTTSRAWDARAYVRQPNGKVETRRRRFLIASSPVPLAGSTVVVPERDPEVKRDWVAVTQTTLSVLGSVVAILAIARR